MTTSTPVAGDSSIYRSPSSFLSPLLSFLGLVSILHVLMIGIFAIQMPLLDRRYPMKQVFVSDEAQGLYEGLDMMGGLLSALWGIAIFIYTIFFLMWIFRLRCNLDAVGVKGLTYSPGGTVGWFLVPIANLSKPFRAIKEIWQASQALPSPNHESNQPDLWKEKSYPWFLKTWWAFWVILNLFWLSSLFQELVGLKTKISGDTQADLAIYILECFLCLLLAVFEMLVIWHLSKLQDKTFQQQPCCPEQHS